MARRVSVSYISQKGLASWRRSMGAHRLGPDMLSTICTGVRICLRNRYRQTQAYLSNAKATLRITYGFDPMVMPIVDDSVYGSQMENHPKQAFWRCFLKYSQM